MTSRPPGTALQRVLTVGLLVAVVAFAVALAVTFGPLPGALGLLVPLAVWYVGLARQRTELERYERAELVRLEHKEGLRTRDAPRGGDIPTTPRPASYVPTTDTPPPGQAPWTTFGSA